jgi:hypothetical protein
MRILAPRTGLAPCENSLVVICSRLEIVVMMAKQNTTLKVSFDFAYLPGRWMLQKVRWDERAIPKCARKGRNPIPWHFNVLLPEPIGIGSNPSGGRKR